MDRRYNVGTSTKPEEEEAVRWRPEFASVSR